MTSHNEERDLAIRTVVRLLDRSRDEVIAQMQATILAEVPVYTTLPEEQMAGEIREITEIGLAVFVKSIADPDVDLRALLAPLAPSAAKRAEEGLPMADVLTAYYVGARAALNFLAERAGPVILPAVLDLADKVIKLLQTATAIVAEGYAHERELTLGEQLTARLRLGTALVEGHAPEQVREAANLADVALPLQYAVVAVAMDGASGGAGRTPDPRVQAARRLRNVRSALVSGISGELLWVPTHRAALVLIPLAGQWSALIEGLQRLFAGLDEPVVAGAVVAGPLQVSEAVATALDVRELAQRLGRPAGCYQLGDVAFEYQISRPGPARDALAEVLAPLADDERLRETLEAFVVEDRHRQRTARRLGVHPNTVDNRLRRITTLTSLDPLRPQDLSKLVAGLAATALSG
ncbi:PucR family transcriptional regulator [Nocardioides speluncae]|uniref:PucR family transcriptional regulator n=1 Tax=Nocardioides speluncae TaxID=2670337 RepID=UPI0012B173D2|nr:PucR family transcriptional regulator [Nocardioides speluncae]